MGVIGQPTFTATMTEGFTSSSFNLDKMFAYPIEATKGPILEPVLISSNEQAMKIFGVSFAPHFYQKPTGLTVIRVATSNAKQASIIYTTEAAQSEANIITLLALYSNNTATFSEFSEKPDFYNTPSAVPANLAQNTMNAFEQDYLSDLTVFEKYDLLTDTDTVREILMEIREDMDIYGTEGTPEEDIYFKPDLLDALDSFYNNLSSTVFKVTSVDYGTAKKSVSIVDAPGLTGRYNVVVDIPNYEPRRFQGLRSLEDVAKRINSNFNGVLKAEAVNEVPAGEKLALRTGANPYALTGGSNGSYKIYDNDGNPTGRYGETDPVTGVIGDERATLEAYEKGFDIITKLNVIGVATISDSDVVQDLLEDHIIEMWDPEKVRPRFGVTAFLGHNKDTPYEANEIASTAERLNNQYIIYIGQGCIFQEGQYKRVLPPHECTMLYTGKRSSLEYLEALEGGEDKKFLTGVVEMLPLFSTGVYETKYDFIELQERGVMTFQEEYSRYTWREGLTTYQPSQELAQESIMSIGVHVFKQLVVEARKFHGRNLTPDLKSIITRAMEGIMEGIKSKDNSLEDLPEINEKAYSVEVESIVTVRYDNEGRIIRESKISIFPKFVPIGSLKNIELGAIII